MQEEFINIASHEIKTPTQAILGLSNILQNDPEIKMKWFKVYLETPIGLRDLPMISWTSRKLRAKTLRVRKERFKLNDLVSNVVKDYRHKLKKKCWCKLLYIDNEHGKDADDLDIFVHADMGKTICQGYF